MLAMIASFVELAKSLPAIFGMLLELRQLWNQYVVEENRKEQMVKLQAALKDARVNRDTTKLNELVNSILTNQPDTSSK